MAPLEYNRGLWWCALVVPLLAGCGGSAVSNPGSSGGSTGAGAAGSSATAGKGGGTPGSCAYQGLSYEDGAQFLASDGCNTCSCDAGSLSCTEIGCTAPRCQSGGQSYQPGQTFKNDCNTCTCGGDGKISCTTIACQNQCTALQDQYAAALKRAKVCNPAKADQCTTSVSGTVSCGCPTPVNASDSQALSDLSDLSNGLPSACITPCLPCPSPAPATCTPEGSCENAPFRPNEAACKVAGVEYPSGTEGVPDPASCNKCRCQDGELVSCTEGDCPSTCPSGTKYGTQCAECGPTDACQVVEHACLPTCTDSCTNGLCVAGICREICG